MGEDCRCGKAMGFAWTWWRVAEGGASHERRVVARSAATFAPKLNFESRARNMVLELVQELVLWVGFTAEMSDGLAAGLSVDFSHRGQRLPAKEAGGF